MNKLIFVLLFSLLIKPVFPLFEYAFNYEYISKVLCENKDKPKLNCCGKCHLKKQLAKASEETSNNSDKKHTIKSETELLFIEKTTVIDFKAKYYFDKALLRDNYNNFYFHTTICSLLRPPISF